MSAFIILIPFLLAGLVFVPHAKKSHAMGLILGIPSFILSFYLLTQTGYVTANGPILSSLKWIPYLDIHFSIHGDGLGFLYAFLICFIGGFVLLYSDDFMHPVAKHRPFFAYMCAFMASMLGIVLSDNLIQLFIFWELTGFCSFLLISYDSSNPLSKRYATHALLITAIGGLCLLAGFILLGNYYGSFSISDILASDLDIRQSPLYSLVFILIFIGASTKSAQFPFHFWLPNAMVAPTPVSAYLHSATMVTAGVYILSRFNTILGMTNLWSLTLITIGAITMVLACLQCLFQSEIKRILAYSTLAVLGQMVLLIGIGGPVASTTAVILLFAHAIYKATLFMVSGSLYQLFDTTHMGGIQKLKTNHRSLTLAVVLSACSMLGIPLLMGFTAKEGIYASTFASSNLFGLIVLLANIVLGVIACTFIHRPLYAKEDYLPRHKTGMLSAVPAILASLNVIFALMIPQLQKIFFNPAAAVISGQNTVVPLYTFPHLSLPFFIGLFGMILSIIFYIKKKQISKIPTIIFRRIKINPAHLFESVWNRIENLSDTTCAFFQSGSLQQYLSFITLGVFTLLGFTLAATGDGLAVAKGWQTLTLSTITFYEWIFLVNIIAGTVLALWTDKPLTSIMALGIIGINIALIFVKYGAPDLAMTQLLFETLIVVILALVLVQLPTHTQIIPRNHQTKFIHGLIALMLGSMVTMSMLIVLGHPFDNSIGEFFTEQTLIAHGKNIVNVIIVDFRGFDTLGEILVIATSGFAVYSILKIKRHASK